MKRKEMVFGFHAVIETIQAGKEIDKILVRQDLQSDLSRKLFEKVKGRDISIRRVPREKLDRFTQKNHQGVIALIPAVPYYKLEDMVPFLYESGKNPLILLLDGITDVRNFGSIARTCVCTGVDTLVIPALGSVSVCADAVKTSSGALISLPVCREKTILDAVRFLKMCGYQIYASAEKADISYTQTDYTSPTALVIGNEEKGISPSILRLCDQMIRIPVLGNIASLNVSVAAAVLLYEAIRQRNKISDNFSGTQN